MRAGIWGALVAIGGAAIMQACGGSSDDPPPAPPPPPPTELAGLDARPSSSTCIAPPRDGAAGTTITLQRVFPSLTFDQPLAMLQAPGEDSRWFVLERGVGSSGTARIRAFPNRSNVSATDVSTFLTLTVNAEFEGGLLGMAFHPNWSANRHVFVSYTAGSPMVSYVDRYTSLDGGATLDASTREEIIRVNQPNTNHNGGHLAFNPNDGFLYFGLGDGGGSGDPDSTAQDTTDLLGSMLRLNVSGALPYTIPSSNPFAGQAACGPDHTVASNACPELFAWGLRNPWRFSFDSATGELWLGDVGQGAREEIDRLEVGGNYGWDCREGLIEYGGVRSASCSTTAGLIDPVHDYDRALGVSVTGGYVYRGSTLPALVGRYVFGDFGSGRIFRLVPNGSGGYDGEQLLDWSNNALASFAEANDGELFVVDIAGGGLYAIVDGEGAPQAGPASAMQLSTTGCVDPHDPRQPAAGLVSYAPAAPYWSDGAAKERWLSVPTGTSIARAADGDFDFPNGSVLMQHLRLNDALIETRLLMRHPDGQWAGYSYEWNAQGTDATLVQGGKSVAIGGQTWTYPSENECLSCHTSVAGYTLALEAAQLNQDHLYASTGRTANQLRTLDHIALFNTPLGDPALQPSMPDPFDTNAPLDRRARAYLHTNCAHCHRPGGVTTAIDLRYDTLLQNTGTCDAPPQAGDLGIGAAARIITPGNPATSVLVARVDRRDANGMPPLASNIVDSAGVTLLHEWVTALASCR